MTDERKFLLADEHLTGGLVREATYSEEAQVAAERFPIHLRRYVPVKPMSALEVRDFYEKEVSLRDERIKELEKALEGMVAWFEMRKKRAPLDQSRAILKKRKP